MRVQQSEQLDRAFRALADPSRRRMIDRLASGPASVSELAEPLGMALPSVLKHLAVLQSGGLVESEKAGRVRTYRLGSEGITSVETWLSARKSRWNAQFDALEMLLAETPAVRTRKRR